MRTFLPLLATLALSVPASAIPTTMVHQGRLFDQSGLPMNQTGVAVRFAIYDTPSSGTALWNETIPVDFDNGYFTATIGGSTALDDTVFDDDELYLGVTIGTGTELPTRIRLATVPFAFRAGVAESLDGGIVDAAEIRVNGTTVIDSSGAIQGSSDTLLDLGCSDGEIARFDTGSWTCAAQDDHGHTAGDITSGTLDLARLPTGDTAGTLALGDHTHSTDDVTTGTFDINRLPTGSTAGTVAAGDHAHSYTDLDVGGQLDVGGLVLLGSSSAACGATIEGSIRYDEVNKELYYCDGSDWILFGGRPLGSLANPGTSCKAILDAGSATGDHAYWLDPSAPKLTFCNMSSPAPDYMLVTPDQFYHADQGQKFGATNGVNVFDYGCDYCSAARVQYDYDCPDTNWEVSYYQLRSHCNHNNHQGNDTVFDLTTYSSGGVEGIRAQQIGDSCGDPNEMTFVGVCRVVGTTETDPGSWDTHFRTVSWSN